MVQSIMARVLRTALVASLLCALAACHASPVSVPAKAPGDPDLWIAGNPESASGATWTMTGTLDGTTVDLQGILLKPRGRGPFPAVVLSHGAGGNAQSYGRELGSIMRTWGLVCIAPNYTHARGAPPGAPGTRLQQGASQANAFRAHAAVTVLARLGYVDTSRVAAHGHSMGAFVTTAFAAAYPADVRVASHTSGGVLLDAIHREGIPIPSVAQARRIKAPVSVASRPPGLRRPVPPRQAPRLRPRSAARGPSLSPPQSRRGRRRSRGAGAGASVVHRARDVLASAAAGRGRTMTAARVRHLSANTTSTAKVIASVPDSTLLPMAIALRAKFDVE